MVQAASNPGSCAGGISGKQYHLKRQFQGKLKLARIKHGTGSAKHRIRRARNRHRQQAQAKERWWIGHGCLSTARNRSSLNRQSRRIFILLRNRWRSSAENRRAVDRAHLIDVGPIQHVEGVNAGVEPVSFLELKIPRQAQVPGLQAIPYVRVPSHCRGAIGRRCTLGCP